MLGWINITGNDIFVDPRFLLVGLIPYFIISMVWFVVYIIDRNKKDYDKFVNVAEKMRLCWLISTVLMLVFVFAVALTFI